MNHANKAKKKDVVKITYRAALRIALNFGDIKELVRIIQDKE